MTAKKKKAAPKKVVKKKLLSKKLPKKVVKKKETVTTTPDAALPKTHDKVAKIIDVLVTERIIDEEHKNAHIITLNSWGDGLLNPYLSDLTNYKTRNKPLAWLTEFSDAGHFVADPPPWRFHNAKFRRPMIMISKEESERLNKMCSFSQRKKMDAFNKNGDILAERLQELLSNGAQTTKWEEKPKTTEERKQDAVIGRNVQKIVDNVAVKQNNYTTDLIKSEQVFRLLADFCKIKRELLSHIGPNKDLSELIIKSLK